MKKRTTLSVLAVFICIVTLSAQTVLYNFETGTTQLGTYSMAWGGAPYIGSYAAGTNPDAAGINSTATSLNLVENAGIQWWNNFSVFTLTSGITINASNRYLHILFRTSHIDGGGFSVNLNSSSMLTDGDKGKTRFDANLTANNVWQDVVIDLNHLLTNNIQLTSIGMNPDLYGWSGGSSAGGTYNFDEIILSNSPLPRGTTFLTGNNLYDFEPGTAANISGVNTSSNSDNPVTYPVANPMNNAKNTTANVGKRSVIANAQWWTGFSFNFTNPVQVDANHKYLHILISVPVDGQKIALDVKQGATNVIADGVKTISTANVWEDVVYDVSSMAYISGLSLKMGNWSGTAVGDYYFDEIYINDSATPRTDIGTGIIQNSNSASIVVTGRAIRVSNNGQKANVVIYNADGQVAVSKNNVVSEQFEMKNAGLYIVKTGSSIEKVMVK